MFYTRYYMVFFFTIAPNDLAMGIGAGVEPAHPVEMLN